MLRKIVICCLCVIAGSSIGTAGDHYHFRGRAFAAPAVVYPAPVVAWQPAYVVPTPVMTVAAVSPPVVAYHTHYYAPAVPVVTTVSGYYAPRAVAVSPVYYGRPRRLPRGYRGVEIEFERDGDIEIDYR